MPKDAEEAGTGLVLERGLSTTLLASYPGSWTDVMSASDVLHSSKEKECAGAKKSLERINAVEKSHLMPMITLTHPTGQFGFRTAGVAYQADQVLLHRAAADSFWSLPGGRVELHEESQQALIREMLEEMGAAVAIERLLWVHELFFLDDQTGCPYHSLEFYYLMHVPPSLSPSRHPSFLGKEGDTIALVFRWFPLPELASLPLYPVVLRTALLRPPTSVKHLVTHE